MLKLDIPVLLFGVILFLSHQCYSARAQDNSVQEGPKSPEAKYEELVNQVLGNFRDFSNDLLTIRTGMTSCTENSKEHMETRKQIETLRLEILEMKKSIRIPPATACPEQEVTPVANYTNPTTTEISISSLARSGNRNKAANHILLYRPGTGTIWILKNQNGIFSPVYSEGDPGRGIARYDLRSTQDRVFPFDFAQTGQQDHLVFYRPGNGTIWVVKREENGQFTPVFEEGDQRLVLRRYALLSGSDRVVPFDFNGSGLLDHLVLYRPGEGFIWIGQNFNGTFVDVFISDNGIQGFDLKSPTDRVFPFDYDHSGKMDHLVLYRAGKESIAILKNTRGTFSVVYGQNGIGGYDLKSESDRLLAFDYDHSGKQDHLVLYRPGTGTLWILKHDNGTFKPVYQQGDPGIGIGGYDLRSTADRVFAFDYDRSGLLDHLVLYRPGTGTIWILKNENGRFLPVFQQGDPGHGIGGYDLKSPLDRVMAFDY